MSVRPDIAKFSKGLPSPATIEDTASRRAIEALNQNVSYLLVKVSDLQTQVEALQLKVKGD